MASAADLATHLQSDGRRHGHPSPRSSTSGFSPLARSAMSSNANGDISSYLAQMGGGHRPLAPHAGMSHAHARPPNSFQSNFNPPTAPAAMRAGGLAGGTTRYSPSSVQWRPNPLGTNMTVANDIQRRFGGRGLVGTAGLPDNWV